MMPALLLSLLLASDPTAADLQVLDTRIRELLTAADNTTGRERVRNLAWAAELATTREEQTWSVTDAPPLAHDPGEIAAVLKDAVRELTVVLRITGPLETDTRLELSGGLVALGYDIAEEDGVDPSPNVVRLDVETALKPAEGSDPALRYVEGVAIIRVSNFNRTEVSQLREGYRIGHPSLSSASEQAGRRVLERLRKAGMIRLDRVIKGLPPEKTS
jgi:hypothetical protein